MGASEPFVAYSLFSIAVLLVLRLLGISASVFNWVMIGLISVPVVIFLGMFITALIWNWRHRAEFSNKDESEE